MLLTIDHISNKLITSNIMLGVDADVLFVGYFVQTAIGKKWKEIIDVTDKITYSFHVHFILLFYFSYFVKLTLLLNLILMDSCRMIQEGKDLPKVDTLYEDQCEDYCRFPSV